MRDTSFPWLSLLLLGAVHGINPAMGWLFAVARGLQERNRRALWRALGPLAIGHAFAIAAALAVAVSLGRVAPLGVLRWIVAGALLLVGVDGLRRHRHVQLKGMRVSGRELATWSFLMASAHGAGLMVLPFVLGNSVPMPDGMAHHHAMSALPSAQGATWAGIADVDAIAIVAPLVHTLGYLVATILLALVVYEKLGVRVLRRAWINFDLIWGAAMVAAAVFAVIP
ncbi:MAG: hypothetical protein ACJ79A_00280 [Gemmatimonadaceae bacterium]